MNALFALLLIIMTGCMHHPDTLIIGDYDGYTSGQLIEELGPIFSTRAYADGWAIVYTKYRNVGESKDRVIITQWIFYFKDDKVLRSELVEEIFTIRRKH